MTLLKNTNLQIILGIVVMDVLGGSLIGPILPSMIGPLNATRETIGLVLSIYTLFAVIFTPILGALADRIGRKKVLVPITIIYGLAGLLITFTTNFYYVLILRAFQGIGVAGMTNLAMTLIGDLFHDKERAQAMGYRTSAQNITTATIPFIAGILATIAWFYPFYIYSLAIPVGIIAIYKLKFQETKFTYTIGGYIKSAFNILKNKKTIWVFISNFTAFLLLFCMVVYFPLFLSEKFSLSTAYMGLALSIQSISGAITASQSKRLVSWVPKPLLVIIGFLICGIALFLIPFGQSFLILIPVVILFGAGFGMVLPSLATLATELAPTHLRAGVMSVFSLMIYIGQTLSPLLFGLILKYTNFNLVFISGGVIAFIPAILIVIRYSFVKASG